MSFLAHLIAYLNIVMNFIGKVLLSFIAFLPGWLSNTIISAVVGLLLLIIFKYTSNQKAVGRVRDNIKAQLLGMKLFKDNVAVVLKSQGQVLVGAFLLLFHSLRPLLVMFVLVILIIIQMALWYESRPLKVGEQTLVTMELNGTEDAPWPQVVFSPPEGAEIIAGPVKVFTKRQIYWEIKAVQNGYHQLKFNVKEDTVSKDLAVGDDYMRVSIERPDYNIAGLALNPVEKPFADDSPVRSIRIDYPKRLPEISSRNGLLDWILKNWWWIYFFVASMVFALIFKPFFNVRI
jgi:uncharacterized membrane protein (DUF106 family)